MRRFCFWFCFAVMLAAAVDRTLNMNGELIPDLLGNYCVGPVAPLSEECWVSLGRFSDISIRNRHIVLRSVSAGAVLLLLVLLWRVAKRGWSRAVSDNEFSFVLSIACVVVGLLAVLDLLFPDNTLAWIDLQVMRATFKQDTVYETWLMLARYNFWFPWLLCIWFWLTVIESVILGRSWEKPPQRPKWP